MNNKKETAEIHNLSVGLKKAFQDGNTEALHKAAQAVVNAGYELEEMKLLPTMRERIEVILFNTNWNPDFRETML